MGQNLGATFRDINACNVLVLGLDNSGKSSIINCIKARTQARQEPGINRTAGNFSNTPTIGFRLERVRVHSIPMTLIDMSGQGRYRNLWEYYYKECDAIVFVVDSADRERMPVVCEENDLVLLHPNVVNRTIPHLYFCNKMDRTGAMGCDEVVHYLKLQGLAGKKPLRVFCSNGLTGNGVTAGFEWLADQLTIEQLNRRHL